MQKWEYAWVVINTEKRTYRINGARFDLGADNEYDFVLNDLGGKGWELVTAELPAPGPARSTFVFKRPLQTP